MQLSKVEKANQAVISEDGMSVTSHKGYRMVRLKTIVLLLGSLSMIDGDCLTAPSDLSLGEFHFLLEQLAVIDCVRIKKSIRPCCNAGAGNQGGV